CSTPPGTNTFAQITPPWDRFGYTDDQGNMKAWRYEPPLVSEHKEYVQHVKGKLEWRQAAGRDQVRVFENSFQVNTDDTYTVSTWVGMTVQNLDPSDADWRCQDGSHPRLSIDANGNPKGFKNQHSWNACNPCRVFINPPGCSISLSGSNSREEEISAGESYMYTVIPNPSGLGGRVGAIEVYIAPTSCDISSLDNRCWTRIYSGGGEEANFSYTFGQNLPAGQYYMICNASNNNPEQFYNGFWCSGNPSVNYLSRAGVPSCGPNSSLLINLQSETQSSCEISLSVGSFSINVGDSTSITASVSLLNPNAVGVTLSSVSFNASEKNIGLCADQTQNSQCSGSFYAVSSPSNMQVLAKVVGINQGKSSVNVTAQFSDLTSCSTQIDDITVGFGEISPWYQIIDGGVSVIGDNSSISASIPNCITCYLFFGQSKGIPVASSIGVSMSRLSANPVWNVQNPLTSLSLVLNYDYYERKVAGILVNRMNSSNPGNVIRAIDLSGSGFANIRNNTEYYIHEGLDDIILDVSELNIPSGRRVVLFVNNADNLEITGNLLPNSVRGFFMVIARNNVTIRPSVTDFTGIIHTDGTLSTGTRSPLADNQLNFNGMVYAGNISLQRNLIDENAIQPAERFTYLPSLILQYPPDLSGRRIVWRESPN
ncbi:MAG: hypothetical protein N2558_01850, partial [Patescibacteria group bacterium]|nr:hypothetical protein [Patescibacteria group bacterium]